MASVSFGINNSGLQAGTINGPVYSTFYRKLANESNSALTAFPL
jgi:hypothetical protein